MEKPQEKKRILFLHANTHNPSHTERRTRNKSLDSKVRRHLMVDIGKSRRKPSKAPQFDTLLTTAPILHALSVFEKEWGEDWFSAYGFTLIIVAGRNALSSTCSTNTFWFPFAFKNSAFLHHYQQIFTLPDVIIPLYRKSARELRCLALERSLITIQCVESRLSSSDASSATSDDVLQAVLALVCYNFTSLDFDQAMMHVKGMGMVIAARGGIPTLEANQDLMLMISWVDITAALLHDARPLFPVLSAPMASVSVTRGPVAQETLPAPLLSIINEENTQNIMFSLGDLNALAALLRFELAAKGDTIWDDEEQMGFLINPVTHQLLNQHPSTRSEQQPESCWGIISEVLRLGGLIWIIRVKRRCRSYPGTAEIYISKLLKILSSGRNKSHAEQHGVWNSPDLRTVRRWLLVLCSIGEPNDKDLSILMQMIASEMKQKGSVSWVDIMADVRKMPWVDIFEPPCAKLGQRLREDYLEPRSRTAVWA
ncbi:hypothetical protein B0H63DRAFT_440165 [Podospora didyma]|uniref:Uncharacterized protein n=1 Tax=Podospora didyma TaxID=330526 RepID=A0AAE0N4I4_9PEZI|nr:hypothetical protein B0H63DRAFT_440165 [Podospora didyma]